MKRFSYKNYAEFRTMRGNRVRKTEKAELAELHSSIEQLVDQRDYDSLDALRKVAAALVLDPEADGEKKTQFDIYFILASLVDKKQCSGLVSALYRAL